MSTGRAQIGPPVITVAYPKDSARLGASDSTFIFGQVIPRCSLFINGQSVPVYRNGTFVAFLPLTPGPFTFNLAASKGPDTTFKQVLVFVPEPVTTPSPETLRIAGGLRPSDDLELRAGDVLTVAFRGTPGCQAFFRIDGLTDALPMAEAGAVVESSATESVFQAHLADTVRPVRGFYRGAYQIQPADSIDTARIIVTLVRSPVTADAAEFAALIRDTTLIRIEAVAHGTPDTLCFSFCVRDTAPGRISIRRSAVPQVVELTDSIQILRTGPGQGFLATFQPQGIKALYTGRSGQWVRLKLAEGQEAWTSQDKIRFLPPGTPPPTSTVTLIRVFEEARAVRIELPLSEKLPFRVDEELDPPQQRLTVYGLTSAVDWIRQYLESDLVRLVSWEQPQKGVFRLTCELKPGQLWGYDVSYEKNTLVWVINKQPAWLGRLKGLVFTIDPGHSADQGALGPTGLEERQANLWLAIKVADLLRKKGATVVMTRTGMEDVPLMERPKIAKKAGTHIYLSIHNNALPDGVNPFFNNGTSVYYYHPHSRALAEAIHKRMVAGTGLPDFGLYYANFAVDRPTQYLAVLVECAFMMIPEQEEKLRSEAFQEKVASLIVAGVEDFLLSVKKKPQTKAPESPR